MKTMAIRLEDKLHAQLVALSQLEGISLTDVIRQALDAHLVTKRSQPELTARADAVLAEIEQEAADRRGAIAALFANGGEGTGEGEGTPSPKPSSSTRTKGQS